MWSGERRREEDTGEKTGGRKCIGEGEKSCGGKELEAKGKKKEGGKSELERRGE